MSDRRSRLRWISILCLAGALAPGSSAPAFAQEEEPTPGVSPDRVLFGQSAALSGPAAALGQGMRLGIQAAFAEINRRGGVHGRQLELVSVDDGYEPEAALTNTRRLLQEESVFALIGPVGTPTSRAVEPVAAQGPAPRTSARSRARSSCASRKRRPPRSTSALPTSRKPTRWSNG